MSIKRSNWKVFILFPLEHCLVRNFSFRSPPPPTLEMIVNTRTTFTPQRPTGGMLNGLGRSLIPPALASRKSKRRIPSRNFSPFSAPLTVINSCHSTLSLSHQRVDRKRLKVCLLEDKPLMWLHLLWKRTSSTRMKGRQIVAIYTQ